MNLHIVTPCTRDQSFLDRCYESIRKLDIPYSWFIVTEESKNVGLSLDNYENTFHLKSNLVGWKDMLNYYLNEVEDSDQWVYVLDDDNLMHENFTKLTPYMEYPQIAGITFSQRLDKENNIREMNPESIAPMKIDQAQFILRRSDIADLRYWNIYRGDGYFILEFKIRMGFKQRQMLVTNQVACNYNAQHWS